MYASFLMISRALHLDIFKQPGGNYFFNNLYYSYFIAPSIAPPWPIGREQLGLELVAERLRAERQGENSSPPYQGGVRGG
jgi:hypothetical protein